MDNNSEPFHNKNKVKKLTNEKYSTATFTQGDPMVAGVSAYGYTQQIMEGQPLGTFFTYEFVGYDEDGISYIMSMIRLQVSAMARLLSRQHLKTVQSRVAHQPKLNVGWNNSFSYKNWECFLLSLLVCLAIRFIMVSELTILHQTSMLVARMYWRVCY